MKIAMIGSRGIPVTYSGIETHLEQLCPRLARKGHKLVVYCKSDMQFREEIYKGVHLKRLPAIRTKHLETLSRSMLSVFSEAATDSDIVHFHALGPSVFSFLPRWFRKRTVVTVHGLDWQRAKWGRFARLCLKGGERTSAYFSNATICVSQTLQRYYHQKHGIHSWYIPNGVDIHPPRPPEKIKALGLGSKNYILFLSRLVPEKGCHLLIRAFNNIDTDLKLVIAGGPGHTEDYVRKIKKMASSNRRIVFTGFVSGTTRQELFSNAYLYVLPSEIEGLPIALLEAMSYGRCVVTSDIPENHEVIKNCGYAFKNRHSSSLQSILTRLLKAPELVTQSGIRGKQTVRRDYNWDKIADRTERIYETL